MSEQKPSIGRIVRYVGTDGELYAAIITGVSGVHESADGVVDLVTFGRTSVYVNVSVRFSEHGEEDGTWHWPPRA